MFYFAIAVFGIGFLASFVWVSNLDLPLGQSLAIWAAALIGIALLALGIAT